MAITIAFEATCLHTRQAKSRSPHAASVGAPQTTSIPSRPATSQSRSWTSSAAEDALEVALAGLDRAPLEVVQDPRAGLLDERLDRGLVVAGGEEHLDELLREPEAERRR